MSEQEIEILVERVKRIKMTPIEAEQQRRSFAFGNANIENSDVTREVIDRAAEHLSKHESGVVSSQAGENDHDREQAAQEAKKSDSIGATE